MSTSLCLGGMRVDAHLSLCPGQMRVRVDFHQSLCPGETKVRLVVHQSL